MTIEEYFKKQMEERLKKYRPHICEIQIKGKTYLGIARKVDIIPNEPANPAAPLHC